MRVVDVVVVVVVVLVVVVVVVVVVACVCVRGGLQAMFAFSKSLHSVFWGSFRRRTTPRKER